MILIVLACFIDLQSRLLVTMSCFFIIVTLARDQMKELGYEREEYTQEGPGKPAELTEALLRYDMNKTYYLRG